MSEIEGLHGAALVTRGGSVALEWAGGPAGDAAGSSCTINTRFQIASVSKQFAAVATMLLVDDGTVDLFDPVERWLPQCPPRWRTITLRHLLSHTAGISHWGDAPGFVANEAMPLEERVALICNAPLLSEPGTTWHYSSPGYLLVGYIVSRAAQQPYGEFLTKRVLAPLGLTTTTVGEVTEAQAVAHGFNAGIPVEPWDLADMPGTGDICSTVGDMARYNTALHGGSLLSPGSLDAMTTGHAVVRDDDDVLATNGYGYGVYLGTSRGHSVLYHPGDNPGYKSFDAWVPDYQASVVILSNDESDVLGDVVAQLLDVALATS